MKRINFRLTIFLLLCCYQSPLYGQLSQRQLKNLYSFAKIYGYVRFFHPSDEAKIDYWNSIAINGTREMLKIKDDKELIKQLTAIFNPIAPTIIISETKTARRPDVLDISPTNLSGLKEVSWQHLGFDLYSGIMDRPYYSIRLNRKSIYTQKNEVLIPLARSIDVRNYKGKKFELSISVDVSDPLQHALSLKMLTDGKINSSRKIDGKNKTYHFNGEISDTTDCLSISIKADTEAPISIGKATLFIKTGTEEKKFKLDGNSYTTTAGLRRPHDILIEVNKLVDKPLYNEHLNVGDFIDTDIAEGIHCVLPMALYGDDSSTYPKADPLLIKQSKFLSKKLTIGNYFDKSAINFVEVRCADVIILWNILKHSFPYWDDVQTDARNILEEGLLGAAESVDAKDFLKNIEKMCSFYNDAHMFITIDNIDLDNYRPPIFLSEIGNEVLVREIMDTRVKLLPGDVILKINDTKIKKYLTNSIKYYSGSEHKKRSMALSRMMEGEKNSFVKLLINRNGKRKTVSVQRTDPPKYFIPGNIGFLERKNQWLKPGTYYFDLTRNSLDSTAFHILEQAESIIFDLRGYVFDQTVSQDLIPALTEDTIIVKRIFTPKILYPDYQKITYYANTETYYPNKYNHIKGKIIFLTDVSAMSASESLLGIIKDYKLGTIIGTPTAGTNGTVNIAYLPGGLTVYYSGELVTNHDGSKHHLVGIIPDVYVTESSTSIKRRQDAVLERALELLFK
jgi:hypothetical protein